MNAQNTNYLHVASMSDFDQLPERHQKSIRLVFDSKFYCHRYDDVSSASHIDPFVHFMNFGWREDRDPCSAFSTSYYLKSHPDVAKLQTNPFVHWVLYHRDEGVSGVPDETEFLEQLSVETNLTIEQLCQALKAFDRIFYLSNNSDIAKAPHIDPFEHFMVHGWKECRNPSRNFSINEYYKLHPELRNSNTNPFVVWLEKINQSRTDATDDNLTYLKSIPDFINLSDAQIREVSDLFDSKFYLDKYADVSSVPGIDPFEHFMTQGWREMRDPRADFSTKYYLEAAPDVAQAGINPFIHWVIQGRLEQRLTQRPVNAISEIDDIKSRNQTRPDGRDVFVQHLAFASKGPYYEQLDTNIVKSRQPKAKLLAYYLPQFHAIPENDAWWGHGFTEWRNVVRGLPRFHGHQQPRVPEQLGFYDLTEASTIREQIRLAKSAGVYGFCFYYYNFGGRRILEKPIEIFLADKTMDHSFALMWANENWTRTWDGNDEAVLLKQNYETESENAFLEDTARHFKDHRYVLIQDRPIFFIYRPGGIPDAKSRIQDWRHRWKHDYGVEPLLFMAQGFGDIDPEAYGLDGAIEFPPHKICQDMQSINTELTIYDPEFTGNVVSYEETIKRSLGEQRPSYPLIKTVVPSWDNEARRPGRGMTIHGSTPKLYENWLRQAVDYSHRYPVYGEHVVCVNAWNEWAEGAYLEPDVYSGSAYINATARAVTGSPSNYSYGKQKLLVVGHDAYLHGAQLLVRNLIQTYTQQFGLEVHALICGEGPLLDEYRELAESLSVVKFRDSEDCIAIIRRLVAQDVGYALVNTTVCGWVVPLLKDAGVIVVSLIHELSSVISEYKLEAESKLIASLADTVVFPASVVEASFCEIGGPVRGNSLIRPQGLYRNDIGPFSEAQKLEVKRRLGISDETKIVINVGYADLRKGFDIFLAVACSVCKTDKSVRFIWVGSGTPDSERWLLSDIKRLKLTDQIKITGYVDNVSDYYGIADAFFFTSREDPFPSVILEALAAKLPIVAVDGLCGTTELVRTRGKVVDIGDHVGQVSAVKTVLDVKEKGFASEPTGLTEFFMFDNYCFDNLRQFRADVSKVSVVIPNYNYANYIEKRLVSVFRQSYPIFEVIVLDDASTDNSIKCLKHVRSQHTRKFRSVVNLRNSGSVFRQWRKAVEESRGEYIWIAEADDDSDPRFAETVIEQMIKHRSIVGFTDSWQMDTNGRLLGDSYRSYMNGNINTVFDKPFRMSGLDFLKYFLSIKNVILNVSGVVFKREALKAAIKSVGDDLYSYKVAGDWRLYASLCLQKEAFISYCPLALNGHRRHQSSVTQTLDNRKHYEEIVKVQNFIEESLRGLDQKVLNERQKYRSEVKKYLGL